MTKKTMTLAVSAALCLYAGTAAAETESTGDSTVLADATVSVAAYDDATTLDSVSVVGTGQTRQVQSLGMGELQRSAPGTSPLKVMAKLPGVNFQSSDPWGNYEWSTKLSVRGFSQQQLGFVLDGVPLGDMSYGNHNGLSIGRAAISENLVAAELSQGSGAIDTASTGNLGGTLRFFTSDPSTEYGVQLAQTLGSNSTSRTYARLDTGDHRGFSAYLSGSFHDADKWKGEGPQRNAQFNGKAVFATDSLTLKGYAATSRRRETDYADLSLESARRLGMDWDNYAGDWQRAIDAAGGIYSGGVTGIDDAYYVARGLRDDDLLYVSADWAASEAVGLSATAYYHRNEGQGHWATPYVPSPQVPISIRTTEYDIERTGIMPAIAWDVGMHSLRAGLWLEKNAHGVQRNHYFIQPGEPPDGLHFLRDPDIRVFRQRFDTDTRQYYVVDSMQLADGDVAVDAGFKGTRVEIDGKRLIGSRAGGRLVAEDNFLPQVGARWRFNGHEEVFGSYTENMAAFRSGVNGPHSTSQAAFDAALAEIEPETSRTIETGLRTSRGDFQASLALYRVDFENRLLAIARCSGIQGCPSTFANVGDVRTRGAELTALWRPVEGLSWYNALSWNKSEYAADYVDGVDAAGNPRVIPVDGKQVVDSPERLFSTELLWNRDGWTAQLGAKYTGRRYLSYLNDSSVDGFWVADASVAYGWQALSWAELLKLQLSVTNLFDKRYFASLGTNGFAASDPEGRNYTLQPGAPRQVFLTAEVRF